MRILVLEFLVFLALLSSEVEGRCSRGFTYPISKRCRFYMKCDEGVLRLAKCDQDRLFDPTLKTCIRGRPDQLCDEVKSMLTEEFQAAPHGVGGGKRFKRAAEMVTGGYWTGTDGIGVTGTVWPNGMGSTGDHYWTGSYDADVTATIWPDRRSTSEADGWTGTDGLGMTGTVWSDESTVGHRRVTSGGHRSRLRRTTEGDYWTGTDNPGRTGTEWPDRNPTTEGGFWTGTDGTEMTGTFWPAGSGTTQGDFWTGTDGPGRTGTEWPVDVSTAVWTATENSGTGPSYTVTTTGGTLPFSTDTVSGVTESLATKDHSVPTSPDLPSTLKPSGSPTATSWTVSDATGSTGTEWTVR